jgi:hypothetical protein
VPIMAFSFDRYRTETALEGIRLLAEAMAILQEIAARLDAAVRMTFNQKLQVYVCSSSLTVTMALNCEQGHGANELSARQEGRPARVRINPRRLKFAAEELLLDVQVGFFSPHSLS